MGKNPVKKPKIEDDSDEEMEDLKPTDVEKLKKKYDEVYFFLENRSNFEIFRSNNDRLRQRPTSNIYPKMSKENR